MKWIIYKHTLVADCPHKGWSYIGITKQTAEQRWKDGFGYTKQLFGKAIKKYGWDNFTHEILEDNIETLELANKREKYWIAFFHTYINDDNAAGYNTTRGGDGTYGYQHTEQAKEKMHLAKLGQKHTAEYNAKLSKLTGQGAVICIETGKVYYSLGDAFRQTNIRHIHECCHGARATAGGYHWAFANDEEAIAKLAQFQNQPRKPAKVYRRKILCIELDLSFDSIHEAAVYLNLPKDHTGNISRALKTGQVAYGFHWQKL